MATGWLPESTQESGWLPAEPMAASGSWLPATSSGPTYGSGLTLGAAGQSVQQSLLNYQGSALGQMMKEQQDAMLTKLGLDPSVTDIDDLPTLDADVAKNEAAIAKLATFNPELAEDLMRRHSGEAEESKGFFGDMMDTLGDFMAPALSVGAKALELLMRPSQMIPELIVDAEDDPWYEDLGQALSGKSHAHGDDVIRKWFPEASGFTQGLAGFAVDVVADPLTWLTFGMAGVGRVAAGQALAKTAGKRTLVDAAESGAFDLTAAMAKHGYATVDEFSNAAVNKLTTATKGAIHEDALISEIARTFDSIPDSVIKNLYDEVNPLLRQMNRTGLGKASPEVIKKWMPYLEKERAALQAKAMQAGTRAESRALSGQARALAGAMGGTRFVAGVPFTRLRYVSRAVPGTYGVSPFGPARNFFRGMSGINRLDKVITRNTDLLPSGVNRDAVYDTFFREGWEGLNRNYPALMGELGSRFGIDSMFRPLSEQMGKMTRKMANHTQYFRNGDLDALYSMSAEFAARGRRDTMLTHVVWSVVDEKSGRPIRQGRDMVNDLRNTLDLTNRDKVIAYARLQEALPGFDRTILDNLDEYEKSLGELGMPAELAAAKRGKLEALKDQLSPEEIDKLLELKRVQRRIRVTVNKNGGALRDRGFDFDSAEYLDEVDSLTHAIESGGRRDVAERVVALGIPGSIGVGSVQDTAYGRGIYGRSINVEATPKSVVKGKAGLSNFSDADIDAIIEKGRGGGFTVDTATKQDASGGYAVAVPGEKRVSLSSPNLREEVRDYLNRNSERFESDEFFLGGWVDKDELVLDATRIIKDADEARLYGASGGQDGIINLDDLDDFIGLKGAAGRVTAKNPLMLDNLHNSEYFEQVQREVRENIEGHDWDEALLDSSRAAFIETKVRQGITARLREDGFDSIVKKNSDDDWEILSFAPEALDEPGAAWGVKAIHREAPKVRPTEGYFPRVITDEGRQKLLAKYGQIADDREHLHLSDLSKSHELRRKLEDMDIVEANDFMRSELEMSGDFFHLDPLEAHARYGQRTAEDMQRHFLQGSGLELSDNRWGVGSAVSVNSRKFGGSTLATRNLRNLSDRHKRVIERQAEKIARDLEVMEKHTDRFSLEINRLREEITQFADDVPTVPRGKVGTATRRAAGTKSREAVAIGESLEKVRTKVRQKEALLAKKGKNLKRGKAETVEKLAREVKELRRKEDALMAIRRRLSSGKTGMDDPATKQVAQEALADAVATRTQRIAKLEGKKSRALVKAEQAEAKLAKELDTIRTRYQSQAARPEIALIDAGSTNPLKGYEHFERLSEIDPNIAMHPFIAAEFRHSLGTKPLHDIRRNWRRFIMGPWKTFSTVYYPGFHARNFMGAWFNSWLGGVGIPHFNDAFRIARALKGDTKWSKANAFVGEAKVKAWGLDGINGKKASEVTYTDVGDHLEAMLIRGANANVAADAFPDAAERIRRMQSQTKIRDKVPGSAKAAAKPVVKYGRLMRQTTETTENFFRTATYLRGLEVTGGSPVGARAFTMMRHGDYEDLNDYEEFIKDLVPFYKWMRTNVPFQVRTLLEAPGKSLATVKAQNVGFAMAGEDIDLAKRNLPPWVKQSFVLALPKGEKGDKLLEYLALDLPMADLFTGANDYLGAFLPMIRPFVEANVLKSRLGPEGGTVPLKEKVPLSAWAALPGIRQVLEPWVTTGADGKEYIDGDVQHMMSAVPVFSRFKNWIYADEKAQKRRAATFWSAFTGVRPEAITDEEITAEEKAFYYDELLPLITGLKDMGVGLPDKDQVPAEVFEKLGLNVPEEETTTEVGPFGASPFGG